MSLIVDVPVLTGQSMSVVPKYGLDRGSATGRR